MTAPEEMVPEMVDVTVAEMVDVMASVMIAPVVDHHRSEQNKKLRQENNHGHVSWTPSI